MIPFSSDCGQEPFITVGLIEKAESVAVRLKGEFADSTGRAVPPGEYHFQCLQGVLRCAGPLSFETQELELAPADLQSGGFSLEATIGIDFHWQQQLLQTFQGSLKIVAQQDDCLMVINRVPLETYIISVICSEMNAESPPELAKAHAVISRSWLLAQLESRAVSGREAPDQPNRKDDIRQIRRWTDRRAHTAFDVCGDDHCQRYQGIRRVASLEVAAVVSQTRGQVLAFDGKACDARFSKCCGGVSEDFRTAWGDEAIPYLKAVFDGPKTATSLPQLAEEQPMRKFIAEPPDAYCNCTDEGILQRVLTSYDRDTKDFFRWRYTLPAREAGALVKMKLGIDLGRIVSLQPVERGPSGRLKCLRLIGEADSLVVGKELEIRRALSPHHLYSSAFVIDAQGPAAKPDAFVLTGAGWGHGVGLCQIGAAVMACKGIAYQDILKHYYQGTEIERFYA